MPVLLIVLLVGVLAYLYWRRATTTLTRKCRWRQERARGLWRCAYCGAEVAGADSPSDCLMDQQ